MYKYIIVLLFCIFINSKSFAQSSQVEAKAAYLLAEESYGKGDMKSTVQYLDDAVSKLGGANAKILYLKIMAQRELANKDQAYLAGLDSTITVFQKLPDLNTFNEDKVLEIAKIKIQLKKEINQKKIDDELRPRLGMKGIERDYPDWHLGAPISTLREKHPDLFILLDDKANKRFISKKNGIIYYEIPDQKNGVDHFGLYKDRLFEFELVLYKYDDDKDGNKKGKEAFAKILNDFKTRLGDAKPSLYDLVKGIHLESFKWVEGAKSIELRNLQNSDGHSTAFLMIKDLDLIY